MRLYLRVMAHPFSLGIVERRCTRLNFARYLIRGRVRRNLQPEFE